MTYCVACGIETKEMFRDSCQRKREQAQTKRFRTRINSEPINSIIPFLLDRVKQKSTVIPAPES